MRSWLGSWAVKHLSRRGLSGTLTSTTRLKIQILEINWNHTKPIKNSLIFTNNPAHFVESEFDIHNLKMDQQTLLVLEEVKKLMEDSVNELKQNNLETSRDWWTVSNIHLPLILIWSDVSKQLCERSCFDWVDSPCQRFWKPVGNLLHVHGKCFRRSKISA